MISNSACKDALERIKSVARINLFLFDMSGGLMCSTGRYEKKDLPCLHRFIESGKETGFENGIYFNRIDECRGTSVILAACGGRAETTETYLKLAAMHIGSLLVPDFAHPDCESYFKDVILDNMLPMDIVENARYFHLDSDTRLFVCDIETTDVTDSLTDALKAFGASVHSLKIPGSVQRKPPVTDIRDRFPQHQDQTQEKSTETVFESARVRDNSAGDSVLDVTGSRLGSVWLFGLDESHIICVAYIPDGYDEEDYQSFLAQKIYDLAISSGYPDVKAGYGNYVTDLRNLSHSYKEAAMALEVGRIFCYDSDIISYGKLGIGRLIYQLPHGLCKMFLNEVFSKTSIEELDDELLQTVEQFFDDSLNVSEASRNLYIHRNTLVYRLDKLEKLIGLNIRKFDDALTLKIALMVSTYMEYLEKNFG